MENSCETSEDESHAGGEESQKKLRASWTRETLVLTSASVVIMILLLIYPKKAGENSNGLPASRGREGEMMKRIEEGDEANGESAKTLPKPTNTFALDEQ